jgi:YgiT-type zinc finger domain-containing protein
MMKRRKVMFCDSCKVEMNDSTTMLELDGKETTVKMVHVPCSVCPKCGARVVDGVTLNLAKKAASKCKEATVDFDKMRGLGLIAGKITG